MKTKLKEMLDVLIALFDNEDNEVSAAILWGKIKLLKQIIVLIEEEEKMVLNENNKQI